MSAQAPATTAPPSWRDTVTTRAMLDVVAAAMREDRATVFAG
jgi:hypothetical protein